MLNTRFGIEIEFTGLTRNEASKVAANYLNGAVTKTHDSYDTHKIITPDGIVWKVMYDGSIRCERKVSGTKVLTSTDYRCELVSPVLTYTADIEKLQEIVRLLRKLWHYK